VPQIFLCVSTRIPERMHVHILKGKCLEEYVVLNMKMGMEKENESRTRRLE
jgi:hypothetical protein